MNRSKRLRTFSLVFVFAAAPALWGCSGSSSSPTGPSASGQPDSPATAPAPAPLPGSPGALAVTVSPNPAPWSGDRPAPDCEFANRWQYDQTLRNTGGTRLTITDRADAFDGVEVSRRSNLNLVLEPGAETTIRTHWCSANNVEHRARTNFSGVDDGGAAVTVAGTMVRLLPR